VFSSACIASKKPFPEFQEAKTLRPHYEFKVEVNAIGDDGEKRKMPRLMHADSDEEDEAEDKRRGLGREENDDEAAKRRKFLKDDEKGKEGGPAGDHEGSEREEEHSEQDARDCRAMKKMVNPRIPV